MAPDGSDSTADSNTVHSKPPMPSAGLHRHDSGTALDAKDPPRSVSYHVRAFVRLFFTWKFISHRLVGLLYLLQYTAAVAIYVVDYESFRDSWLLISLPITAVLQTTTAMLTFTFLPRKVDGGYVNDVGSISYQFVCENMFFVLILAFQYCYFNDHLYPTIKQQLWPLEYAFVFLPYFWRAAFPQTRLRDTTPNLRKDRSTYTFYVYGMQLVRSFYLFGKHIIGFHLNYLRFANLVTPLGVRHVYLTSISGSFSTTVAIFLHTLRFKKYIPGWVGFSLYACSFGTGGLAFLLAWRSWFVDHPYIVLISLGGLLANRIPRTNRLFDVYQLLVMAAFHWGFVKTGGSWAEVVEDVTAAWQWVALDGVKGGQWTEMVTLLGERAKEVVAHMVANPGGRAGEMW